MHHIVIDKKGSQLDIERNILIIRHASFQQPISIPLAQIGSVTITTPVDITSRLLTRLAEYDISVCILPHGRTGMPCFLLGSWHAATTRREQQYALRADTDAQSYWAAILIRIKLHQQARTLSRLQTDATTAALQTATHSAIEQIKSLRDKFRRYVIAPTDTTSTTGPIAPRGTDYQSCRPLYPIGSLLGTEGSGSAIYFQIYQQFFAPEWQFTTRNRRPPRDPVNVVLSLSYTLLQHLYQQAVYSVGFDPYCGLLHSPSYNRQSLACDFTELQRAEIDYWVWELFDQGILIAEDFSQSDSADYPCELLKSGRRKFYEAFATLRPTLQTTALRQVWLWQRRIQRYHGEDAIGAAPRFVTGHNSPKPPPL